MKSVFTFVRQEAPSVFLVFVSLIPLVLLGWILDIVLIQWFSRVGEQGAVTPAVLPWVLHWVAGHRGVPQEMMLCFWLLMMLSLVFTALLSSDQTTFRTRFMYSFFFAWILAISVALVSCHANNVI